jgi:hypothetical protein
MLYVVMLIVVMLSFMVSFVKYQKYLVSWKKWQFFGPRLSLLLCNLFMQFSYVFNVFLVWQFKNFAIPFKKLEVL